jgi:hypothetical protein
MDAIIRTKDRKWSTHDIARPNVAEGPGTNPAPGSLMARHGQAEGAIPGSVPALHRLLGMAVPGGTS